MDDNRRAKVMALTSAIVESVMEGDDLLGTPGGYLYAALMTFGMTLEQFTEFMEGLVNAGALTKMGQCYHVTALGREYVMAVKRIENRIKMEEAARAS